MDGDSGYRNYEMPPEGSVPSTPETGDLVAGYERMHEGFVYVYADGRVIWYADNESSPPDGAGKYQLLESHLSPAGVDLVRSGAVVPREFLHHPMSLPANAWADLEIRPYVPSRYAVCYYTDHGPTRYEKRGYEDPSRVLGFFPAAAQTILRDRQRAYEPAGLFDGEPASDFDGPVAVCSEATTDEARALDEILADVRVEDAEGDEVYRDRHVIFPHGGLLSWGG